MKILKLLILALFALPASLRADNSVNFVISDGIDNGLMKTKMEQSISSLLSEVNSAQAEKRALRISKLGMTDAAVESLTMLWENVPFRCDEDELVEHCLQVNNGYQVRNIPLTMKPEGSFSDDDYQEAVISFNTSGQITSFYLTIGMNLYSKIMKNKTEITDIRRRMQILDYVEHFRTAYNQKDLKFLNQVFSDDALIITGSVIQTRPSEMSTSTTKVTYKKQNKRQYLTNLERTFLRNAYLNILFDDIKVVAHPNKSYYYGVTLHQKWNSTTYSDEGIVFLLWDFSDENNPVIHVRTWQPDYLDKGKTQKISAEEIFTLSDFDL